MPDVESPVVPPPTWSALDVASADTRARAIATASGIVGRLRPGALYFDLEWRLAASGDWTSVWAYVAEGGDATGLPCGYAPFFSQERPVSLQLGEMRFAAIPLTRHTLVGEPLLAVDGEGAAGESVISLLRSLRAKLGPREAVCFEGLPLEGPTYRAISSHEFVRDAFVVVHLGKPFEHHYIEMPATFDEYMKQLGSRSRQSLQYSERKLARDMHDQVRLEPFRAGSDVDKFVHDAAQISRKTYQWNLLGLGLRDETELSQQLRFAADRGFLRSYILYCGDAPAAFMLGCQEPAATYYYMDVGYDPQYAAWSVGSILQLKVLRDLYSAPGAPAVFDFSTGEGAHKARFGNRTRPECNVLLLPRSVRSRAVAAAYSATDRFSVGAASVLERIGLKARLKKLIRRAAKSQQP